MVQFGTALSIINRCHPKSFTFQLSPLIIVSDLFALL